MAKRTILELVQDVGASIGSDEIDELDETQEATDILTLLKVAFTAVINRRDWEFMKNRVRQLDVRDGGDTQINRLALPSDAARIDDLLLKYKTSDDGDSVEYQTLQYMSPVDFIEYVLLPNSEDDAVDTILNSDNVPMLIYNDRSPSYFTSFDEEYIWFDAYNSAQETGNSAERTMCICTVYPEVDWEEGGDTLPVPESMETLVYNEALVLCAARLRQTNDPYAALDAARQYNKLRESEARVKRDQPEINYGRRRRR